MNEPTEEEITDILNKLNPDIRTCSKCRRRYNLKKQRAVIPSDRINIHYCLMCWSQSLAVTSFRAFGSEKIEEIYLNKYRSFLIQDIKEGFLLLLEDKEKKK